MTASRRHFLRASLALLAAPLLPRAAEAPTGGVAKGPGLLSNEIAAPLSCAVRWGDYIEFWALDSGPISVTPGDEITVRKAGRWAGAYTFVVRRAGVVGAVAVKLDESSGEVTITPLYVPNEPEVIEMKDLRV